MFAQGQFDFEVQARDFSRQPSWTEISVRRLTDADLERELKDLVQRERDLLEVILHRINEVEIRRLHLERGYPSMYEYLTKECRYSGSAAIRRLEAARLLRVVPAAAEKIEAGELNLSQIGELSRAIKEKEKLTGGRVSALEKSDLVERISGKTAAETQKELAQALDLPLQLPEKQRVQKDESVRLEITLSREQYALFLACRDRSAHVLHKDFGGSNWASLFTMLVEKEFRLKNTEMQKTNSKTVNQTLTPKTRRQTLNRDRCCQYKDPETGKICGSTYGLEVDHRRPQWAGGTHAPENLQTLCKAHNNHKYRKEAGLRCAPGSF